MTRKQSRAMRHAFATHPDPYRVVFAQNAGSRLVFKEVELKARRAPDAHKEAASIETPDGYELVGVRNSNAWL